MNSYFYNDPFHRHCNNGELCILRGLNDAFSAVAVALETGESDILLKSLTTKLPALKKAVRRQLGGVFIYLMNGKKKFLFTVQGHVQKANVQEVSKKANVNI